MKKLINSIAVTLAMAATVHAGVTDKTVITPASDNSNLGVSIGAEAGTTGLGGSVSWKFSDHFGIRAGADGFDYTRNQTIKGTDYDGKMRLLSENIGVDIYPWQDRSFRITVGALFNQNKLTATASRHSGSIKIDGANYSSAEVGTLNLQVKQQPVDPFLSIGGNLFYFDTAHQWAFTGEIGVVYTGNPKVDLNRSGGISTPLDAQINESIKKERAKVKSYAADGKFWPIAKLGVSFSF